MRKALILAIGLAAVMVFATRAAAHRGAFFGHGFGAPGQPFFAMPPALVAPPIIVTPLPLVSPPIIVTAPPARFVPHAVIVITPRRF
jgi:hypothetical protein